MLVFFSFLLDNVSAEFSNPFPQAARLGSQQLWTGMGLAGVVLAPEVLLVCAQPLRCQLLDKKIFSFNVPVDTSAFLPTAHKTEKFLEARPQLIF